MNQGTTLLPSYYGVEWPSGYPQESGDVPTLEDLDNSFAAFVMGLGAIPPPHDGTAGQVINSNVPRSHLPIPVPTSAEGPHPRLPALEYASMHQSLIHFLSQSNSMPYSTPTSSRNSYSWCLQEDPGYSTPIQPHSQQIYSTGSPGFHTGNQMELPAPSTLDNHAAQGHSDHPSHTLSDHRSIPCGWRDDEGHECTMLVHPDDCKDHFADVHGIKRMAWYAKIICHWCPSEKEVSRKYFLRHMKEVHLGCSRSNNRSTVLP
ncbi:hypothetical protein PISMIDRAFT_8692 [Pisolithus microcarpus 441]|uniref:Uncharacterized protein n=1 Tax=Pisolithus microcarpus 441 TaxID=765257 RepID=A0A0C9ZXM4_9AGAM|nr:hypothetical protein BKA83DRAFT_8692 [Pisolithus microcarpus]KIK26927.1 hypothetical protein PISMIDRAFT_8692 [Pisolithus microcarpus 441]